MSSKEPIIGVVGPCASGKSTLVAELRARNIQARHIAQEHSYVQDMWKQIGNPDFLIYLDVSFEISKERTGSSWTQNIFNKQVKRLEHAKEHADICITTDSYSPEEVLQQVLSQLDI
jgi:deoxyadenosine/deoxycytidine kinase